MNPAQQAKVRERFTFALRSRARLIDSQAHQLALWNRSEQLNFEAREIDVLGNKHQHGFRPAPLNRS